MSRPPRFFIGPSQVQEGRITLTGDDVQHVRTVLRKRPGDLLTVLDGAGNEYTVRIAELERGAIVTEVLEQARREIRGPRVVLGQGLPKSDKMDWIVQKATELGVASIVPLVTERTIMKVRDEEKRLGRWRKIAREAAMQSARPDIPSVQQIMSYHDFLRGLQGPETPLHPPLARGENEGGGAADTSLFAGTLLLLPWEEGTTPVKDVLRTHAGAQDIIVLIGPEGGFSQAEAEAAKERGFHAVNLGPNILRTETAAVAVLSMLFYEYSG